MCLSDTDSRHYASSVLYGDTIVTNKASGPLYLITNLGDHQLWHITICCSAARSAKDLSAAPMKF